MKELIQSSLTPPKKERLNEKIISQIKHLILSNNFKVGQRLPSEREMANRLRVSRVVVRETLRSLEQAGLIEIKPGAKGGPFVTNNLHLPLYSSVCDLLYNQRVSLSHLLEARETLECSIIKLAAKKANHRDIKRLKLINQRFIDKFQEGEKIREINANFHMMIAEISENPLLKLIIQSLFELLNRLLPDSTRTQKFTRRTYEKHEAIIEAMRKRDIGACERLMSQDIKHMKNLKGFKLK